MSGRAAPEAGLPHQMFDGSMGAGGVLNPTELARQRHQALPGGGHQHGKLFSAEQASSSSAVSAAMFGGGGGGGGGGSFTLDPELLLPPPAVRTHVHPAQQLDDGMMPGLPFSLEQQLLLMQAAGSREPHGGTPRSPAAPPHGTVFFAGVTPVVTADTLLTLFSQFGRVLDLNLFRPFKGCRTSKGCGLVVFASRAEAAVAMDALHGKFVWPGARSAMVIEWQDPDKQHKKRRAQPLTHTLLQQLVSLQQQQQQQQQQAMAAAAQMHAAHLLPGFMGAILPGEPFGGGGGQPPSHQRGTAAAPFMLGH